MHSFFVVLRRPSSLPPLLFSFRRPGAHLCVFSAPLFPIPCFLCSRRRSFLFSSARASFLVFGCFAPSSFFVSPVFGCFALSSSLVSPVFGCFAVLPVLLFFLLTASLCPPSSLPPSLAASLCVPYSSSFAVPASLRSLLFISSSWRPPCPFFRGSRLPAPVLPSWPLLLLHGRLPTSLFSRFAPPLFPLFFCPCFFSFC